MRVDEHDKQIKYSAEMYDRSQHSIAATAELIEGTQRAIRLSRDALRRTHPQVALGVFPARPSASALRSALRGAMPHIHDPRCDELDAMLGAAEPRRELVYRTVLIGLSPHCAGDPQWKARVGELRSGMSEAELAEVLGEAQELRHTLQAQAAGL